MNKASILRDMAEEELKVSLNDLKKEIYQLVNDKKRDKKLEKPHLIRQKKKERARVLTILHEKQSAS